ncbi:hypothetical protein GTY66_32180 [Streptomyces sp. SID8356]|uniref:hypothetical protein n=1 Tax=unclassified Streptomyces TaxID=2593676 RepID=UPI0003675DD0|nr:MULTISPECIES: hypothetical protein [unclassified Streptomyces]MYT40646.1 hypothetical protein [Streptomyces sp. SID8356]
MTTVVVPQVGELLSALRPGSRAIVRVTERNADGVMVVDAATLGRARSIPRSVLRPFSLLYRGRPPKSGYVPLSESDFVHRLLDAAFCEALGTDDPGAVVYVRAHPDWASGGVARLAYEDQEIVKVCVTALERAGYGAEPARERVSGFGSALRFRRKDRQPLCPALEKPPRNLDGWEPWSCDLDRDHEEPHHNLVMRYHWTDDTGPDLCGAWVPRMPGRGMGSCTLPAGHPPAQRHRDE